MPYDELPPLSDDLDLNNFDTLATSSKRTQNLGPLWFIPPRYKPTRSSKAPRLLARCKLTLIQQTHVWT